MKRFLILLSIIVVVSSVSAAKIYYEDGSHFEVDLNPEVKALKMSPVEFRNSGIMNVLVQYKVRNRHFVITTDGRGTLPVYNQGKRFFIADNVLFWRGKNSDTVSEKYDMELVEILSPYGLYKFKVDGDSVKIAQSIVENGDGFAFANIVRQLQFKETPVTFPPEDEYYKDYQWYLKNSGSTINPYGTPVDTLQNADIRFDQAMEWIAEQISEGGLENFDESVKVAIMDSGVDPDHPDLKNKLDEGWSVVNDEPGGWNDEPEDGSIMGIGGYAHGTNCAGVSAAEGNSIGTAGVCPWCGIYPVHYMSGGMGGAGDEEGLLKIYEKYVEDPKIAAINCSFGSMSGFGTINITNAQKESHTNFMANGRDGKGGVIVYAAGNDSVNSDYEELHHWEFTIERDGETFTNTVVTVAASSAWDTRVAYSNFGASIDVAAPSLSMAPILGITTPTLVGYGDLDDDYSTQFSGTSAAAPVVTGVFGVIFSVNPDLTLEEANDIVIQSADKINPETGFWDQDDHSMKFGYGRVNLLRAVKLAAGFDMCDESTEDIDETSNNMDDNCDNYVDEGLFPDLSFVGTACSEDSDCVTDDFGEEDVECLSGVFGVFNFEEGYCTITNGNFACPDGTKTYKPERSQTNCLKDCNTDHKCPDDQICTDPELGVCVPICEADEDCGENAYCDEGVCSMNPSEPFGVCEEDEDCLYGGMCFTQVPDGICIVMCQSDSQCGDEGAKCVTLEMQGQSMPVCVPPCEEDSDCRNIGGMMQLKCHEQFSGKESICGMPCEQDSDCKDANAACESGTCVFAEEEEEEVEENDVDEKNDADEVEVEEESSSSKKSSGCSLSFI